MLPGSSLEPQFVQKDIMTGSDVSSATADSSDTSASGISGISGLSGKSFCRATALFLILCAAAAGINTAVWHHSGGGSYASMFYLNPFVISPQPVIGTIQKAAGIPAGLAVYISAVTALSGMLTCMFSCMRKNAGRIVITRPK